MAEQQKLEDKRQKAQLAANIAMQISNMTTAGTALIAQIAKGGVVGLLAGAAAAAQMFSLLSNIRKLASSSAGGSQRLYTDGALGDYLHKNSSHGQRSGFVNINGRSDVPGRGLGHRVEDSNLFLGGREFVTNENTSQKQRDFMPLLNSGVLYNYNLYDFFKTSPPIKAFNKVTTRAI